MENKYNAVESKRALPRGKLTYSFRGKSTYIKPTVADFPDMATGSDLWDIDTGQVFAWDDDIKDWILQ